MIYILSRTESILPGNENILSISKNNYLCFDIYYIINCNASVSLWLFSGENFFLTLTFQKI